MDLLEGIRKLLNVVVVMKVTGSLRVTVHHVQNNKDHVLADQVTHVNEETA